MDVGECVDLFAHERAKPESLLAGGMGGFEVTTKEESPVECACFTGAWKLCGTATGLVGLVLLVLSEFVVSGDPDLEAERCGGLLSVTLKVDLQTSGMDSSLPRFMHAVGNKEAREVLCALSI